MCKFYAYMRVSTSDKAAKQTYERQKYILDNSNIEFDAIFEEHISGGVRGDQRAQFNKLLEVLQPTDVVCFTETSRFGRNYIDCFQMLDLITQEYGASVRFLSNGVELVGGEQLNPYTWLTISNFFLMDEFQKRQIGYNTKNALAKLKADGVVLGAPRKHDDETRAKVREMRASGKSYAQISNDLGLAKSTINSILNS